MMKKGFTLLEMLVVIVVLATLMGLVFRLSTIGSGSNRRSTTIYRLQCLENCLSGYYAAFGSYPPVKYHGSPDPYFEVNKLGIQKKNRVSNLFAGDSDEVKARIDAACRVQPIGCKFPYPEGLDDYISDLSDQLSQYVSSGDSSDENLSDDERNKLIAGFDSGSKGGTGRFDKNKNKSDWRNIQLFQFGVLSFLLPRYLVMMNGAQDFFDGSFAQWAANNAVDMSDPSKGPSDPFTGESMSWEKMWEKKRKGNATDIARLANIPSQAVCARWMPNLSKSCNVAFDLNGRYKFFGVNIVAYNDSLLGGDPKKVLNILYSPNGPDSNSYNDLYVLDSITMLDGWGTEFYYHSPSPYQKYTLWSAGPNYRTFPPWMSRETFSGNDAQQIAEWISDDITKMSN